MVLPPRINSIGAFLEQFAADQPAGQSELSVENLRLNFSHQLEQIPEHQVSMQCSLGADFDD